MSWVGEVESGRGVAGVLALNPRPAAAFDGYARSVWLQPHVPGAALALCYRRLAQLHRCAIPAADRDIVAGVDLDAGKAAQLSDWHRSEWFSAAEKACLAFAEIYAQDPQAISDAQANAVIEHYGEPGLVALVQALGLFDGECRLSLLLATDA